MATVRKTGRRLALVAATLLAAIAAEARLDVQKADGGYVVLRDGARIAFARADLGDGVPNDVKSSFSSVGERSRVWNDWSEEERLRYRLECAVRADGAVEITLSGEMKCDSPFRTRRLLLTVPACVLAGREVRSYKGTSRIHQMANASAAEAGDDAFRTPCDSRFVAVDGLTFDFAPIGASNEDCDGPCSIDGCWETGRDASDDVVFAGGAVVNKTYGGWVAAKVVIREGAFEDFDNLHFHRFSHYGFPLGTMHLLSFGAPKMGPEYASGEVSYESMRGHGWCHGGPGAREVWRGMLNVKTHVGAPEGAYYSCISGEGETKYGPAEYLFAKLADGHYIVTVGAGNYTGVENGFDILVNGEVLAKGVSVPRREARAISRVFHVAGGELRIRLVGNYILSAIGVQGLLADGEDFSFRRGFWVSDGYEPAHVYRNSDDAKKQAFAVADETYFLPVPGEEAKGPRRELARPKSLPDRLSPSLSWLDNPRIAPVLFNWGNFAEIEDRDVFLKKFDEVNAGKGVNAVMLSGFLSRHTFPAHEDRAVKAIAQATDWMHRRGIKVIDHHDITLCWNEGSGFRVMAERLNEMSRTLGTGLPSFQFCISNPIHNEKQFAYLRRLVSEAKVDGFQLDELEYWKYGCVCAACREKFHAETGLYLPMNECSNAFHDRESEIFRAWMDWRIASVANWDVEARRRLRDLKEGLVLCEYSTNMGFIKNYQEHRASQDLIELSARAINLPGTEVMSRNTYASHRAQVPFRKMFNLLSLYADSPVYGWYYGFHPQVFYFSWCLANMCGQAAILLDEDMPRTPDVPDYLSFGASSGNMKRRGAKPIAEAAVLFSRASRDWNRGIGFAPEMLGIAQELETLHVPYEFIVDDFVTESGMSKYRTVFLAASQCLSDSNVEALLAYAEKGGTVQMSVRAGELDEHGMPRGRWPFEGRTGAFGKGRIVYDPDFGGASRAMDEISPERPFNPMSYDASTAAADKLQAKILGVLGKCSLRVKAPGKVHVTPWREADGARVLHFLNSTGAPEPVAGVCPARLLPPDPFPEPTEDIVVTLPAEGATMAVATSPDFAGERRLPVVAGPDGELSVVVPRGCLKVYTLVRIW